jgi:hypothetical protein
VIVDDCARNGRRGFLPQHLLADLAHLADHHADSALEVVTAPSAFAAM